MQLYSGILGGALLVTGTCIGAGMLGLPVMTAAGGFYPTLLLFVIVWGIMTSSALAFLEVSLWFKGKTNFISMAEQTLGHMGKKIAWVIYLLFLYALLAAYTSGGTTMLAETLNISIDWPLHLVGVTCLFVAPFAYLVYRGPRSVDYINRFFVIGLGFSFASLCFFALKKPTIELNRVGEPKFLIFALPLLITSFGYHLLIPTLKCYLKEQVNPLRMAIILGGALPLVIYTTWEYVVLNWVPTWGNDGLVSFLHSDGNPGELLVQALGQGHQLLSWAVTGFSFCALTSSFVGVALGVFDFFSDGLKVEKTHGGKLLLLGTTFLPPILYTLFYPQGFLLALEYAGVFAAILLIVYPTLMVWQGRYRKHLSGPYRLSGGKPLLIGLLAIASVVIAIEVIRHLGWLPIPHPK